ncbi:hypothetical protein PIB30_103777, partial [Stylosanthes scabra]|nr:hypothetical protein [Stylosanthes scabra]
MGSMLGLVVWVGLVMPRSWLGRLGVLVWPKEMVRGMVGKKGPGVVLATPRHQGGWLGVGGLVQGQKGPRLGVGGFGQGWVKAARPTPRRGRLVPET